MLLRLLIKIPGKVPRLYQDRWLSFAYDLAELPERPRNGHRLTIRPANEDDVALIEASGHRAEPVVSSSLRFWHEYGFRQLYLGFLDNDQEPCAFQFVLDDSNNHQYAQMDYGKMYRKQESDAVQVENLFTFPAKRRKGLALDFELLLFQLLKRKGKKRVTTHISVKNKPALVWARTVGFRPEGWITMVTVDLPLVRDLRKQFVHTAIREPEYASYPLSLFRPSPPGAP